MWEEICKLVAKLVEVFYIPLHDWGMAIIVMTVVFRLLIMPLMLAQTRSSLQMQKIQPLMKAIQTKYADDPVKMQQETQKLYAEAKFNPLAGCVPMIIQMPIFLALFQVLRNIQNYLPDYSSFTFYNIVPNLLIPPSETLQQGIGAFIPYFILLVVFLLSTFLPMLLQLKNSTDPKQKNQTLMMAVVMSIMMLFVGWGSPAGVLLFWGVSGVIATATQQIYTHILKAKESETAPEVIEVTPVEIEVERKQKKKRPTKKR